VTNHLTDQKIIANKEKIYLCAKAFREDASALMLQLSQKFSFDLNDCGKWPAPVYKTNFKNKGVLNPEWMFYLHGSHCRFENLKSGQIVEVKYTEKPEFGCLDAFFFYNYMQTSDKFKDLASWFVDHTNVYAALEILADEGTLTKKPSMVLGSYLLAE